MEYAFPYCNRFAADGMSIALESLLSSWAEDKKLSRRFLAKNKQTQGAGMRSLQESIENGKQNEWLFSQPPVVVCIGSDLAVGACVGPITGSMLKYRTQGVRAFIYGTLAAPVTAKEIKYLRAFLKETHPFSPIVAVDAAVGGEGDVGLIKVSNSPLYPGAGANTKRGAIGDMSVRAIVAEKSVANFGLLNTTRLNLVYSMSEIISEALSSILHQRKKNVDNQMENMV